MSSSDIRAERKRLEKGIAAQENLRGTLEDAVIDSSIRALKKQLEELEGVEQQRKLVSILFLDICSHTEIVRDLDPEDNLAIIDPALKRMARVVDQYGGHVARFQGDGFKAVFGLPVAQENDPDNAVRAGLGIQLEADQIASGLKEEWGIERFQVRVGIDTGLVTSGTDEETERGDTIKGSVVNLAARLESSAAPGTVVISHHTYQHVRGAFKLERLEPMEAKGFPKPVPVYRVLSEKPRTFRSRRHGVEGIDTRMIGRDRELDLLQEIFDDVQEERERQIATIVGEAGVGKSRLLYEFENWVDLQPFDVQLYRGRAQLETRRLPYNLIRSIFDFRFDLRENDPLPVVREKWLAGFRKGFGEARHVDEEKIELRAHILGHLLGIDFSDNPHVAPILKHPEQLRNRSIAYLTEYFGAAAGRSVVLILLEDLHWADDGSLEVLNQVSLRLKKTPVMIAAASRPDLYDRRPNWFEGWDFHRRVDLKPLSRRVSRGLVSEILQKIPDVPRELEEMIVTQAEGNPFYVEELVKMLIEAGVVQAKEPAWFVDQTKLDETEVPATLSGVLQARLERLPDGERVLIQQAAVVGRIFWDQVVSYLNLDSDGRLNEAEIKNGLASLRGRELIYRRETSTFVDALEFIFKHAVLREVTYERVLKRLRKVYHRKIAEWLMEQRGDRKNEIAGLIADHLEAAEEFEEALQYLKWSGEEAARKYANQEAIDYYTRALRLVPGTDLELRYELLLEIEKLHMLLADREAWRQDLTVLEELAERLNDDMKRMEVGVKWADFAVIMLDWNEIAAEKARAVIRLAEALGNDWYAARGYLALERFYLYSTNYDKTNEMHLKKALAGFRKSSDRRWESVTLRTLGVYSGNVQHDSVAFREFTLQALKAAQDVGDLYAQATSLHNIGVLATDLGQLEEAVDYFRQSLDIHREVGSRRDEIVILDSIGGVYWRMGDYQAALEMHEESLELARERGFLPSVISNLYELGRAQELLTLPSRAIESYLQVLEMADGLTNKDVVMFESYAAQAGIIRAKRVLGEKGGEKAFVEDFITIFEQVKSIWGGEDHSAHILCIHLLLEEKDDRAMAILEQIYEQVMIPARKIHDERLRQSYLESNPNRQEIIRLWDTYGRANKAGGTELS